MSINLIDLHWRTCLLQNRLCMTAITRVPIEIIFNTISKDPQVNQYQSLKLQFGVKGQVKKNTYKYVGEYLMWNKIRDVIAIHKLLVNWMKDFPAFLTRHNQIFHRNNQLKTK